MDKFNNCLVNNRKMKNMVLYFSCFDTVIGVSKGERKKDNLNIFTFLDAALQLFMYPETLLSLNFDLRRMLVAGGTFALYSLLCRHMNIGIISSKRVNSNSTLPHDSIYDSSEKKSKLGKFFEKSMVARRLLLFIAMLGMCMLIGDGILTPAISGLYSDLPVNLYPQSPTRNP